MARRFRNTIPQRTMRQLADDMGVSVSYVRKIVAQAGVGTKDESGHVVLTADDQMFLLGKLEASRNKTLVTKMLSVLGK